MKIYTSRNSTSEGFRNPKRRSLKEILSYLAVFLLITPAQVAAQGLLFKDDFELGNICAWSVGLDDMNAEYAVSINPSVSQFLEIDSICGELHYSGIRDESGLVTGLSTIFYNTEEKVSKIELDGQGRPVRIIDQTIGTVFDLDWQANTRLVVSATSSDGDIQANVTVDFSGPSGFSITSPVIPGRNRPAINRSGLVNLAPRGGVPVQFLSEPYADSLKCRSDDQYTKSPSFGITVKTSSPSIISVERCEQPVDDASTTITLISGETQIQVPGVKVGPGQYEHQIPTSEFETGDTLENICYSVAAVVDFACTWLNPISQSGMSTRVCLGIAAAIDLLLGGPTGEGAAIFAGCLAGFRGAELYCKTAGADPGTLVQDVICSNVSEITNVILGPNVTLVATAAVPGFGLISDNTSAPATGPFPVFSLVASGQADVTSLSISPADPAPFEDYTATAQIVCAPTNTIVEMAISGTDGYFDFVNCTVTGDSSCALYVPGAEAGVVDTLTVSIEGQVLRSTVLVF